ncbi:hypothetical protein IFR05_010696 [Cadophora sp. M221]|nr:hypothetical protein IFR05_010696 [Cadophora sp. M221]
MMHRSEPKSRVEKLIKRSLHCSLQLSFPRRTPSEAPPTTPGIVFNIDGVLYNKLGALYQASQTLKYLQDMKIPFVFLTNRWRDTPSEGATWVRQTFDLTDISPTQYIHSPSPFATLAPHFSNELVLFAGLNPERAKSMGELFGFSNIITPGEVYSMYPEFYSGFVPLALTAPATSTTKIKAVFVFDNPKRPDQDKQLIVDLLLSKRGVVGTLSSKNGKRQLTNRGYQQHEQPRIWFGAALPFRDTLFEHVYEKTGREMINATTFGKPSPENFSLAETRLLEWHHQIHGADALKIDAIWMIGDNIETDILGANLYNLDGSHSMCSWKTILVSTGVYRPGMLSGRPTKYWPTLLSTGVWDVVQLALRQKEDQLWWMNGGGNWDEANSDN